MKILNFIKNHPYLFVNMLGIFLTVTSFFGNNGIRWSIYSVSGSICIFGAYYIDLCRDSVYLS